MSIVPDAAPKFFLIFARASTTTVATEPKPFSQLGNRGSENYYKQGQSPCRDPSVPLPLFVEKTESERGLRTSYRYGNDFWIIHVCAIRRVPFEEADIMSPAEILGGILTCRSRVIRSFRDLQKSKALAIAAVRIWRESCYFFFSGTDVVTTAAFAWRRAIVTRVPLCCQLWRGNRDTSICGKGISRELPHAVYSFVETYVLVAAMWIFQSSLSA